MNDYFGHLALRSLQPEQGVQPRLLSRFEPVHYPSGGMSGLMLSTEEPVERAQEAAIAAKEKREMPRSSEERVESLRSVPILMPAPRVRQSAEGNPRPEIPQSASASPVTPVSPPYEHTGATIQENQMERHDRANSGRLFVSAVGSARQPERHHVLSIGTNSSAARDDFTSLIERIAQLERLIYRLPTGVERRERVIKPSQLAGGSELQPLSAQPTASSQSPRPANTMAAPRTAPVIVPQVSLSAHPLPISPAAPSSEKPSTAPTIQVTIGRIEVRATPPSATPKTVTSKSKAMSLEEYLKQRNEGQR